MHPGCHASPSGLMQKPGRSKPCASAYAVLCDPAPSYPHQADEDDAFGDLGQQLAQRAALARQQRLLTAGKAAAAVAAAATGGPGSACSDYFQGCYVSHLGALHGVGSYLRVELCAGCAGLVLGGRNQVAQACQQCAGWALGASRASRERGRGSVSQLPPTLCPPCTCCMLASSAPAPCCSVPTLLCLRFWEPRRLQLQPTKLQPRIPLAGHAAVCRRVSSARAWQAKGGGGSNTARGQARQAANTGTGRGARGGHNLQGKQC